jgi:hypothetical protein
VVYRQTRAEAQAKPCALLPKEISQRYECGYPSLLINVMLVALPRPWLVRYSGAPDTLSAISPASSSAIIVPGGCLAHKPSFHRNAYYTALGPLVFFPTHLSDLTQ